MPPFPQHSIFLYPETLSCFNDKGVRASSFLKWQKVKVGKVMTGLVEVVSHFSVPVVSHCPSMLCAPVSTGPSGAHFPDILGWFSEALPSRMGAGDVVNHVGVVTGNALLDWPGLIGQGAGVRP